MAVHPSGKFLYVEGDDRLFAFRIEANGALTPINSVSTGPDPEGVFVNPVLGFVHVMGDNRAASSHPIDPASGAVGPASAANSVDAFSVRSTAIDATGRLAYVADLQNVSMRVYTIDSTNGEMKLKGTAPTGPYPISAAISPSGRFVYATNSQNDTVSAFRVNAETGLLSTLGLPVPAGDRPFSITIATLIH